MDDDAELGEAGYRVTGLQRRQDQARTRMVCVLLELLANQVLHRVDRPSRGQVSRERDAHALLEERPVESNAFCMSVMMRRERLHAGG